MMRRTFAIAAMLSAMGLTAMAVCLVRGHFAHDEFELRRWNPFSLTYTEIRFHSAEGGVLLHMETTTALSSDNTTAIQANAGPSGATFIHAEWPPAAASGCPMLWADHYRCTPSIGINTSGLSNCWTLEFRCDTAAIVLALLPTWWLVNRIRRVIRGRHSAARGFPVIESPIGASSAE